MVVMRFLDWLGRAPAHLRAEAVPPLVRSFFRADLPEDEREGVDAALTLLLDDPSVDVRRALAETLSLYETAPRHLVIALAHDLPAVAEPVFRRSPCLLDSELLEGIISGGPRVQVAIASRPWVSFGVSEAVAAEADYIAVLALAENSGSDIDEVGFRSMVTRFPGDGAIRDALTARPDLPLSVRQSLIASLGARLNEFVVGRSWLPESRARVVVREACDKATVQLATRAEEEDLIDLIEHLRASGQLTTALLIRSICQGHVRFLEAALSRLAGMPDGRVYSLLVDGRESALRALFRKAGLPERSHAAFVVALQVWRELDYDGAEGDRPRFTRRMIERILTRYQAFAAHEVDDLMAMLRRLASEAAREAARSFMDEARAHAAGEARAA